MMSEPSDRVTFAGVIAFILVVVIIGIEIHALALTF